VRTSRDALTVRSHARSAVAHDDADSPVALAIIADALTERDHVVPGPHHALKCGSHVVDPSPIDVSLKHVDV
jgi:hypothetical protein